jgi:DNA-directed RNA polymerase subunit RPC12/RpoP
MSIEYHCNNCGKRFKPRDYMKLETIYTPDDIVLQGRKCNYCGKDIKIEDKIVKA